MRFAKHLQPDNYGQQFRQQIGQADIPLDLVPAVACLQ
jgi:hypothetical protein